MKRFNSIQVISGGQTGVDQVGLLLAKTIGLATGGTVPARCKTETEEARWLLQAFNMNESSNSNYAHRTRLNVEDSNLTLVFGNTVSKGSNQTIDFADATGTLHLVNPSMSKIKEVINNLSEHTDDLVINIAGNRASRCANQTLIEMTGILLPIFTWLKDEDYLNYVSHPTTLF